MTVVNGILRCGRGLSNRPNDPKVCLQDRISGSPALLSYRRPSPPPRCDGRNVSAVGSLAPQHPGAGDNFQTEGTSQNPHVAAPAPSSTSENRRAGYRRPDSLQVPIRRHIAPDPLLSLNSSRREEFFRSHLMVFRHLPFRRVHLSRDSRAKAMLMNKPFLWANMAEILHAGAAPTCIAGKSIAHYIFTDCACTRHRVLSSLWESLAGIHKY